MDRVRAFLAKGIDKGKVTESERDSALQLLEPILDLNQAVGEADLVIEAIPEDLQLKRELFARIATFEQAIAPHMSENDLESLRTGIDGDRR